MEEVNIPNYYSDFVTFCQVVQDLGTRNEREYRVFVSVEMDPRLPPDPISHFGGTDSWDRLGGWDTVLGRTRTAPAVPRQNLHPPPVALKRAVPRTRPRFRPAPVPILEPEPTPVVAEELLPTPEPPPPAPAPSIVQTDASPKTVYRSLESSARSFRTREDFTSERAWKNYQFILGSIPSLWNTD